MHTPASSPLVTLGMPVFNEAEFLAESLENLLSQTYSSLEIIIADNGSTDATQEICLAYAKKDPRITYVRHPKNIGQNASFNYVPRSASGTYFAWVSGHDILDATFVEDCVKALEADSSAVLAYPRTVNMLADGTHTREKVRRFDIRTMSAQQRFREVMWRVDCNYVYGLWRLLPMLDSKLFQLFPAADRVFLSEMAIKGTFQPVDTFKYYRLNRVGVQPELEKRHRLMRYIYPHKTFTDAELSSNEFYRPTLRGFYRTVQDAGFPWPLRMRLYLSVWLCGVMKSHLFPGADALSRIVKRALPAPVLRGMLSWMQ